MNKLYAHIICNILVCFVSLNDLSLGCDSRVVFVFDSRSEGRGLESGSCNTCVCLIVKFASFSKVVRLLSTQEYKWVPDWAVLACVIGKPWSDW